MQSMAVMNGLRGEKLLFACALSAAAVGAHAAGVTQQAKT